MVSGKVTVKNPTGLHLRPAGTLCKQAMQFKSSITFHYGDGNTANAKSVLSVLGACVKCTRPRFPRLSRRSWDNLKMKKPCKKERCHKKT